MAIDYNALINWNIPETEQKFTKRDTMLYALGVGLGSEPCNPDQLKFVYEERLEALPTMAIILGYPGPWHLDPNTGLTKEKIVQGEQSFVIHKSLPVEGTVVGLTRVVDILDKGPGRGALVLTECTVREKATKEKICTLSATIFCRADGGFGGARGPAKLPNQVPQRPPDAVCDLPTLPQAALIYRLSGDYYSLHVDPNHAQKAGFKAPILHGRCTFGVVGHAILKTCCGYDADRFKSMEGRFSSPVYPGETIRTEMWTADNIVSFRSTVLDRGITVLDNGRAEILS